MIAYRVGILSRWQLLHPPPCLWPAWPPFPSTLRVSAAPLPPPCPTASAGQHSVTPCCALQRRPACVSHCKPHPYALVSGFKARLHLCSVCCSLPMRPAISIFQAGAKPGKVRVCLRGINKWDTHVRVTAHLHLYVVCCSLTMPYSLPWQPTPQAGMEPGKLKVSLRSINDWDTTRVTEALGGGGHRAASACVVDSDAFEAWRL